MAPVPSIRIGNYGNGAFGVKTSIAPYDVTVLADDNDATKRSFNSEWPSICKIKIIGVASSEWTPYQAQGGVYVGPPQGSKSYSHSGWEQVTPILVPTGVPHIPVWEERVYDPANSIVYDDFIHGFTGTTGYPTSYSGARSYHSGPSTSPANTIFFTPFVGVPNVDAVYNENAIYWNPASQGFPGYPAYPAYPAKPTFRPSSVYIIYSNPMGWVS